MKRIGLLIFAAISVSGMTLADDKSALSPSEIISLINGQDLSNWTVDVPDADENPDIAPSFAYKNGFLKSLGVPRGHLITKQAYKNYRLVAEYRFTGEPGNCGVLIHASDPRMLYDMFPRSIEVQMKSGDAGDFWVIGEDISVPEMEERRPRKNGQSWGGVEGDARRIINLTDGSERPVGEWNRMVIDVVQDKITVWVNGVLVNNGNGATVQQGKIAIQAEGAPVDFRKLDIGPLGFKVGG